MRILQFIETGGPGGAERVVIELSKHLRVRGHEVLCAGLRGDGWLEQQLSDNGIPWRTFRSGGSADLSLILQLRQYLLRERIQVVHSHLLDSNFYAGCAAWLAGILHVGTEHGDVHHLKPKRFVTAKLRTPARLGSKFVAVSQFTANKIQSYGVSRASISVIPNPISPSLVSDSDRAAARSFLLQHSKSTPRWIWLHVANLRPVKDQETLIRGFAKAIQSGLSEHFLAIVGDGHNRESLEQLVAELKVQEQVSFLGFHANASSLMCGCDGFILSSVSEALPMVLLEAGIQSAFCIGTAVGGIPDLLGDGRGGLFPAGNPEALSNLIRKADEEPEAAKNQAARLRDYLTKHFSPEAVCRQYETLYSA